VSVRRQAIISLLCVAFLAVAVPAAAHTALEASAPADGTTVDTAVRRVVLTFNEPVQLAGEGAQLLDAGGASVDAAVTVDGAEVTIRPAEPLTAGGHGVRWAVRSGDGHPVRGTIRFTVDAAASTGDGAAADVRGNPTKDAAEPATGRTTPDSAHHDSAHHDSAHHDNQTGTAALTNALAADATRPLRIVDAVLRALFYVVALSAMGVTTFLLAAWEGPRREVRLLCRMIVRLALLTVAVVAAQVVVGSALMGGAWDTAVVMLPETLTPSYAAGIGLRIAGALLLVAGTPVVRRRLLAAHPIAGAAVDVGAGPVVGQPPEPAAAPGGRLAPGAIMLLGVGAIATSFAFVGHAVTTEPRLVSTAAAVAHVAAAAVWGGGLLALVTVLTHRRRRFISPRAGVIAARFSVLATAGVLVAATAGVALAVVRLDTLAELWTTVYGYALLAKVTVVAVVAAIGAYNHFVVVPTLRRVPDHVIGLRLWRLGLIEVVLLVVVAALTSVLVAFAG
jgi:copper transport protein